MDSIPSYLDPNWTAPDPTKVDLNWTPPDTTNVVPQDSVWQEVADDTSKVVTSTWSATKGAVTSVGSAIGTAAKGVGNAVTGTVSSIFTGGMTLIIVLLLGAALLLYVAGTSGAVHANVVVPV